MIKKIASIFAASLLALSLLTFPAKAKPQGIMFPGPGLSGMAIPSFVQYVNTTGAASANSVTSSSFTTTAGDFLAIITYVGNGTQQTVSSITQTVFTNTYTFVPSTHVFNGSLFGGTAAEIWYAPNVSGGTGTITAHWPTAAGTGFSQIQIVEFRNVNQSSPIDIGNSTFSATANPTLTLLLGHANDVVIGTLVTAVAASFNNLTPVTVPAGAAAASAIVNISGNFVVTTTVGAGVQSLISAAAFKYP